MRKIILISSASILSFFLLCITYLSIYGIKTESFNSFISDKIKEYNPKLSINLDQVFFKLNLGQIALNINTKNAIFIANSNSLNTSNIDINLNLLKFFKKKHSINNIKIKFSNNLIKEVNSFLKIIDNDSSSYAIYSQIKEGLINFELDVKFDDIDQNKYSIVSSGSVNNTKLNLRGYDNFDNIGFDFHIDNKIFNISNLKFNYQEINLSSKNIEIIEDQSGTYFVKGDIDNAKTLINPNLILKLANLKKSYLSDKKVLVESKNLFSFSIDNNNKIKNVKIDSIINFNEIYLNNKYQKLIFLKEGTIKSTYKNEQYTADIVSKFAFSENLKLNNDYTDNNLALSLKSSNNQNFKIKGNLSNKKTLIDPKIIFNFIELDPKILESNSSYVETDSKFKFDINNSNIENYFVESLIKLDKLNIHKSNFENYLSNSTTISKKLKLNTKIQDSLYLKNVETKLIFGKDLFKVDLKSNYSLFKKDKNKFDNNILNLSFSKINPKISDIQILLKAENNIINTKEFKKYLDLKDDLIEDQYINISSNSKINFSIDNLYKIQKLNIKSDLKLDDLKINYKSNVIKKFLKNYNDKIIVKNPKILFDYSNGLINLSLDGKYSFKNKEDNIFLKFKGNKKNFEFYSLLNLNNSVLNLSDVQYYKAKNVSSSVEILLNYLNNEFKIDKIRLSENKNNISISNLNISKDYKLMSLDQIDVNFINDNKILNNFKIKRNLNNYHFTGHQIDGEMLVERILKNNNKRKFTKLFDNINTSIKLNINKIYLEKNKYLKKIVGEIDLKNNELFLAKINGVLDNENKFSYSFETTKKNEKITKIFIEEPRPFINNYEFIKGFEEGELKLFSKKIENTSRSNLKIKNFKVKEVPILAKILILASLQGIADLLTGEGIRFDEFEMDFKTKKNLIEIDEMYAIGPAISIMMEGYIEKDRVTSLRGTLVPATTINKTIANIPLLGDILVGKKTGEGVFGVSFKIKGAQNDLKSSVNPIKTLTPRFITRTLENFKGN